MSLEMKVGAVLEDGRTLKEFERLVGKRMQILKETNKDAVVASAIMVLQSIRKETRRYRGKGVRVGRN